MTDQRRPPSFEPAGHAEPAAPDARVAGRDAVAIDGASPVPASDSAVHVFEGSRLPEDGPAEPLSALEAERQEAALQADSGPATSAPAAPASIDPLEPTTPHRASRGMAGLLGSGLLGGLVGAGLALAAQALWLSPSGRIEERLGQLEQRAASSASQDSVGSNERRLAGFEADLKAASDRLRDTRGLAEAAAKRAEEVASRPPPAPDPIQAAALAATATRLGALERSLADRTDAAKNAQTDLERRIADHDQRLATVSRQISDAGPERMEAGLRLIAADGLGAALREGRMLGPYLPALERLKADEPALAALRPYAAAVPPSAAALARDFKPLAERIRADTASAQPSDWSGKLLGIADQIVTIRPTATAATGGNATDDAAKIEAALSRGDLGEAASAWDALPESARALSQSWAEGLKRRVAAEAAARRIGSQALATFAAAAR